MRYSWLLMAWLLSTTVADGQFLKVKKPAIPSKPPTADDLRREIEHGGQAIKDSWDKIVNLNPVTASEELWGEAGRVAYTAAAKIMAKRSPTGQPLDEGMKTSLRPDYGGLVDKITVHWGTPTLDEWAASRFSIRMTDAEAEAQTYGYDIYVRYARNEVSRTYLLKLMAHELMHSRQYERFGKSLSEFGYRYFKEYKKANLDYESNKLEQEAIDFSNHFIATLAGLRTSKVLDPDASETTLITANDKFIFFKDERRSPAKLSAWEIDRGDFGTTRVLDDDASKTTLIAANDKSVFFKDERTSPPKLSVWEIDAGKFRTTRELDDNASKTTLIAANSRFVFFKDERTTPARLSVWEIGPGKFGTTRVLDNDASKTSAIAANERWVFFKDERYKSARLSAWEIGNGDFHTGFVVDFDASKTSLVAVNDKWVYFKDERRAPFRLSAWLIKGE